MAILTYTDDITHFGIADAHGVESFIPFESMETNKDVLFRLQVRAVANRHRHAVMYFVEISHENANIVDTFIANGDYHGALISLKGNASGAVYFTETTARHYEKSWRLIPNPDLDPWR